MDFNEFNNLVNKKITPSPISNGQTVNQIQYNPSLHTNNNDEVQLGNTYSTSIKSLQDELEKTKKEQGLIGKTWDRFKNLTHIGAGSDKVEQAIKDYRNGKVDEKTAKDKLEKYRDGQKVCLDSVADIASSIVAVGAFAMAVPTGGISLVAGLGLSTVIAGGLKVGIKGIDSKLNGREYNSKNILYDAVTGGVNGLFAPITNGLGSSLTKTIGCKLGLEISGDIVGAGAKTTLKSLIVNQSIDVTGGKLWQRAVALGAGMAVDGALGGTSDNVTRAALEGQDKKDIAQSAIQGFIGGLIMSPIIGGGMRVAGKAGKSLGQKIFKNNTPDIDVKNPKPKTDDNINPDTLPKQSIVNNSDTSTDLAPTQAKINDIDTATAHTNTDIDTPHLNKKETSSSQSIIDNNEILKTEEKVDTIIDSKNIKETDLADSIHNSNSDIDNINASQPKIKHYTNDDKSRIIYENGINDYRQIKYIKALDDEHFANAELLMQKGYKLNVAQAAKLKPEEFQKAIKILNKGYEDIDIHDIATLSPEEFTRAEELIDRGLKSSIKYITKLDETSYQQALKLVDKGCNTYFLEDIAKIQPEKFEKILAISNYDDVGKELIKTATEEEQRFAKAIMYGKSLNNVEYLYNTADDYLDLDFNQVLKAKELLERNTLSYSIVPDLAQLDDREFAQAERVLKLHQFSDGKSGVFDLAKLEPKEFEKAMDILNIQRFSEDGYTASELARLDETKYAQAKKLFSKESVKNTYIVDLASQEEKQFNRILELIDKNLNIKNLMHDRNFTYTINAIDIAQLSDEEYARVFKRNLIDKYPHKNIAGLAKIDDDVWSAMTNTSLIKQIENLKGNALLDVFLPEHGARVQEVGKIAINLKKHAGKNDINELTIREKRNLLKTLIEGNGDLFNHKLGNYDYPKFIREIAGDVKLLPNNKEEYCSLLPKLVKAIGIDTKPLTQEVKDGFYNVLTAVEDKGNRFRTFNFDNPHLKLQLDYPRETFIKDINDIISNLSKEEQNIVCDYFGFEFKHISPKKSVINGYPANLNNGAKMAEINNPTLKEIIEKMRPVVQKFSENNSITIQGEPELSEEINQILKAFPEFLTEIGKKQHKTHDYTLDIHSLKVLQNVINNPNYENLPDSDKTALKIAALFHDITKREGIRDALHPQESAFDVYYLTQKLGISEDEKLKIYEIVKNHNWLQQWNSTKLVDGKRVPITIEEQTKIAKDIAFQLRKGNAFEMASILTEADMKSVQRNGNFFKGLEGTLDKGKSEVGNLVSDLKKSAIALPQTKIPNASNIILDGKMAKEVITQTSDGKEIKNVVLNLEKNMDLSKYGFEKGLTAKDLNVLVHALDNETDSEIFRALGQIDSEALLSTSYVNYGQENYHVFRNQGFILETDCDDINAGYYHDFGSGYKKDLDLLKSRYLFNSKTKETEYRSYISDLLKGKLGLNDNEYADLYKKISNKSITELDKTHPDVAKAMREVFAEMEGGKRAHGRQYNEILVTRPKIQGVFYEGEKSNPQHIPEFLRKYAAENNLPIIYFGK